MAEELLALVDAGTIRVIDVLILTKDEDGAVEAMELSDVDELGPLQALEAELAELLAEEDVEHLAAAMEPGSTAGVLDLGEPLGGTVRLGRSAFGRPADRQRTDPDPGDHRLDRSRRRSSRPKETDMPLRRARVGRVGVIGAPVAKTAVVARPSHRVPRRSRRPLSSLPQSHRAGVAAGSSPADVEVAQERRVLTPGELLEEVELFGQAGASDATPDDHLGAGDEVLDGVRPRLQRDDLLLGVHRFEGAPGIRCRSRRSACPSRDLRPGAGDG